jgi:tRNA modification GTPase
VYAPDTIVAPATAPGRGAVAIVRLSGPRALEILAAIWKPQHRSPLKARRLALGQVIDPERGMPLDRAMAVIFPAPHSFTGEDVAELHCHGGPLLVRNVVALAMAHGARFAEPGEFTRRAFLNGRIDLTEAEAIDDLVSARSDAALAQALAQLSGALLKRIGEIRASIISIRAHLEALIDFSGEDIRMTPMSEIADDITNAIKNVASLHDTFRRGQIAHDGVRAAIVGKPNVGKSSLLNLLLGSERTIVSATPGTTRDVVEDSIRVGAYALTIADTAGLRETGDEIETYGIERARRAAADADLVLAVFDGSRNLDLDDAKVVDICRNRQTVAVINKGDLDHVIAPHHLEAAGLSARIVAVSALTGDGLETLREAMERAVEEIAGAPVSGADVAISRERHRVALALAIESLEHARASAAAAMPPEIVAVDVTAAADALARITGEVSTEDVLDAIFSEFCIGK